MWGPLWLRAGQPGGLAKTGAVLNEKRTFTVPPARRGLTQAKRVGLRHRYLRLSHLNHPRPPPNNRTRNRHNLLLCLGRCLNTAPRCGGKDPATLDRCSPPTHGSARNIEGVA
jgi:hypothetical protein